MKKNRFDAFTETECRRMAIALTEASQVTTPSGAYGKTCARLAKAAEAAYKRKVIAWKAKRAKR